MDILLLTIARAKQAPLYVSSKDTLLLPGARDEACCCYLLLLLHIFRHAMPSPIADRTQISHDDESYHLVSYIME
jgi:hypothetical protein